MGGQSQQLRDLLQRHVRSLPLVEDFPQEDPARAVVHPGRLEAALRSGGDRVRRWQLRGVVVVDACRRAGSADSEEDRRPRRQEEGGCHQTALGAVSFAVAHPPEAAAQDELSSSL